MRTKFILLLMGLMLLNLSLVSALEFDNGIEYRNNDLTVDFENGYFFGMGSWFGLNEKIGEATLKSHKSVDEVLEFGYGKEEVTMFYTFNDWELYEDGLGEVVFIDERSGEEIEKEFTFVKQVLKDFQVQDSSPTCNKLGNGTQICSYGYHVESLLAWEDFNSNDIPEGNTTIGIKTYIDKGDYIDAIWTIVGKKLSKHALWTAADGQVAYWKLDESSSTLFDSQNNANMSPSGTPLYSQTGIILTAVGYDSNLDFFVNVSGVDYTNLNFGTTDDFTLNMWMDISETGNDNTIFSTRGDAIHGNTVAISGASSVVFWRIGSGAGRSIETDGTPGSGYHMYTFIRNNSGTDMWLYVDSVLNVSDEGGALHTANATELLFGDNRTGRFTDILFDEFGIWNQSFDEARIDEVWNLGAGCAFGDNDCGPGPTVNLDSPANNTNFTLTNNVVMNATIFDLTNITNVTLYLDGVGNETNSTSGLNNTVWTFTKNMGQGSFFWTMEACNFQNQCNNASPRTFSVDTANPAVAILAPPTTVDFHAINTNLFVNWSINDTNLDACTLEYGGINTTLTCVDNTTSINITTILNRTIIIYANDTLGNINSTLRSWNYTVFQTAQNFNNLTTEGATETFSINFTKSSTMVVSTVNLIYNATINSFPYLVSGNNVSSSSSITIPLVSADINLSFHWNVTFTDGSSVITTPTNQTVLNIAVDDCSSFTNLIYNFTMYDEETKLILGNDTTLELQINLWDTKKTAVISNFSQNFTNVNPVQFCVENSILPTVNYSAYVVAKYSANETGTNITYAIEYHNILNQTIGNFTIPIHIALYDLKQSDSTSFRLTFRDSSYVLAPNILVQVHRQYVQDNDFKIVEIPLTDSNGQTILNLVRNTVVYNFIMVNETGTIIGIFNSIKAFCQDFTIDDCTINLAPDALTESVFDYNEEFAIFISAASYDNATEDININFVTDNLTAQTVEMRVTRNNQFGNRSVCSDTLFSASGLLACDVSAITDIDQFLFISVFVGGELARQDTINLNASTTSFGTLNGAFYAFLLLLFLITMFMEDKKVLVVSLALGWVGVISLGLINGQLIGATSAGIWILVCIGIFLWKLNSEDSI